MRERPQLSPQLWSPSSVDVRLPPVLRLWPKLLGQRVVLTELGVDRFCRFQERGTRSDLENALAISHVALRLTPQGHTDRALLLGNIACSLDARFAQFGILSDADEVLALAPEVPDLSPRNKKAQAIQARSLTNIASYLVTHFKQSGVLSDLEKALVLQRNVLKLRPQGNPDRALSLDNMASYLHTRFSQLGVLSDLDEAISLQRSALDLRPADNPERAVSLGNLAACLNTRFGQLGALSDLEEALTLERSAFELRPNGHPHRAYSLCDIASCLCTRFQQRGALSDLDEALDLQRQALALRPKGDPQRAYTLGIISATLYTRYTQVGTLSDLDEALSLQRQALELYPDGHPERAISLGSAAMCLYNRFTQLGTLTDLDEALDLQRKTLELRPEGHPARVTALQNVATYLFTRFTQLGMLSDLEEALALQHGALELCPGGHPERPTSLSSIAHYLFSRFMRLGALSDLDEALALQRQALDLRAEGHVDRSISLFQIAQCLYVRFLNLGVQSDLDEALVLQRQALVLRPEGNPERAYSLDAIACYLRTRFERLGASSDMDEAVLLYRSALERHPNGHPGRSSTLGHLASCLLIRFERSERHETSWLQESFDAYAQLSDLPQTVSVFELEPVKEWIQAAEEHKHGTTVLAYQTFFRLSVHYFSSLPSLPQNLAQFKQLVNTLPVDAFAACARQGSLQNAIELLEQGRGVFWNQLLRLRSPLDDVVASGTAGRELADRFTQSASLLRGVLDTSNTQPRHDRAWHLQIQLREVVADIRKLPGLDRFLESPQLSDLREAASGGPVIIVNTSKYRSDAIIVLSKQPPVLVPLPITKARVSELTSELRSILLRAKVGDVSKDMMVLLRALWNQAVSPIVTALKQAQCARGSRIWWCPTAEFSLLPLHASGPYQKGEPNLSGLYVSSYTPTLGALVRARRRCLDRTERRPRFLVVGQAQSPGQSRLDSVNAEVSTVSERVRGVADVTCVQDEDANIAQVSQSLSEHHFVHLACHGIPKRTRPFESGFALGDGRLKVEDVMRLQLQDGQFAYLSACHTTVGDAESPDEVIHLAAAMQFAGFRSVIGTMWAVDDAHANAIADGFYERMVQEGGRLDYTRAAWALHRTMRQLLKEVPFDQRVLYVHMGA